MIKAFRRISSVLSAHKVDPIQSLNLRKVSIMSQKKDKQKEGGNIEKMIKSQYPLEVSFTVQYLLLCI